MSQNKNNQDKTEVLIIGSKAQREKLKSKLNMVGLNPRQEAKNLGVRPFLSEKHRETNARLYY